ncbi:MAG: SAF domain-containing protein, partial [Frankiales bacterium]|nr:SAF domain-containing protein [Frankiales bacterium]
MARGLRRAGSRSAGEAPSSPVATRLAAPSWLDTRLVIGVLLVLLSVLIGARVLAGADRSQLVWATNRALAPGSLLTAADVVPVRVRLFESAERYLDASEPAPAGYVMSRGVGAGELLPDDALRQPGIDVDVRLVTVLVEIGHVPPDLVNGQQVDVWVTPERAAAAPPKGTGVELSGAQVVLSAVTIATGPPEAGFSTGGTSVPIVLQVPPASVARLLSATSLG